MDASLQSRAEQLASEFAGQARTVEDLNGLMRLMMKSALERMLNTEMDVHLGRRTCAADAERAAAASTRAERRRRAGRDAALAQPPQRAFAEDGARRPGRADASPRPAIATARSSRS